MSVENDWEPDMSIPFPGSSDDMMNTIATLRARVAQLEAALRSLAEGTKWKSVDKDNMEFEGRVTYYQLDQARAALKDTSQ